jgi:hypothetical protein
VYVVGVDWMRKQVERREGNSEERELGNEERKDKENMNET